MKVISNSSSDVEAKWITLNYGVEWYAWQVAIGKWLSKQTKSMSPRFTAISIFFKNYLYEKNLPKDFENFFADSSELPDLYLTLKAGLSDSKMALFRYNIIRDLIDSIIMDNFSDLDDFGKPIPQIVNPFPELTSVGGSSALKPIETTYSSLPFRYIKELRSIICPKSRGNFNDWLWAMSVSDKGDWFDVHNKLIDLSDPDCVWRTFRGRKQMWCPVRAVLVYLKLHIPLRTYQARMLDSGESDYYRYSQGTWLLNDVHPFANMDARSSINKGFFRKMKDRATGLEVTGMFISTNKTQDINKDEVDRGYCIPWQHEDVLYWSEKLRNWQEKYNPINGPTKFLDLDTKHFGLAKSKESLKMMGSQCFLMRNAAATNEEDRDKPINARSIPIFWHMLLSKLERDIKKRAHLTGESNVMLVKDLPPSEGTKGKFSTEVYYPLHCMRVSLLTAYALDGGVPTPVLSKLIAGHSRLIMTLHYIKVSATTMSERLSEAEAKIENASDKSFKDFLVNTDANLAMKSLACIDIESVTQALSTKHSVGWEQKSIGICLAASNNTELQQSNSIRGCYNGYKIISEKNESYGPVPNGPENCVRCRWFITEARYLNALRCHFNLISYKASEIASVALDLERELQDLEDERIDASIKGTDFKKSKKLESTENRLNKQLSIVNEYASDMNACFTLIGKLISIEENRQENDQSTKLVAVGSRNEIQVPLSIIETHSKLWQLAEISESALVYPEISDDFLNSGGLHELTDKLDVALMNEGYKPYFLQLDKKAKLIASNAMMRAISISQSQSDEAPINLREICNVIDSGRLPSGISFDKALPLIRKAIDENILNLF